MPQLPGAPRFLLNLLRRHGDVYREDGLSAANELLVTICHAGTHIDAIGHISVDGVLHGGILAQDAQIGTAGLQHLDIDSVAPIVRRGVLLDVAGMLGVPALAPAQGIDAAMLADAANRAQVTIEPGDAVLVRTGWGAFWDEPDRYVSLTEGLPGPNLNGARWLVERGITLTGADCLMYEAFHLARNALPVHAFLLQQHGVYLVENMLLETLAQANVTEFLLIILPLRLAGATGSPIRPIALA
ncbi:MAG: cyclase family protein [Chloroflexi bacterium]|nr:cyclase family protein [Chloroflexota bacterium]